MSGAMSAGIEIKDVFLRRYPDTLHNASQPDFGALAYEFAMIVGELFNGAKRTLPENEVIERFASIPERKGIASGPYRYVNDAKAGQYFQFPIVEKKSWASTLRRLHNEAPCTQKRSHAGMMGLTLSITWMILNLSQEPAVDKA